MLNELKHWLDVEVYGSVLGICQGYVTRWLKVVAMGDVWKFESHPFKRSWWSVVLEDVGLRNWVQKLLGIISLGFLEKMLFM